MPLPNPLKVSRQLITPANNERNRACRAR
jgi:hypothetical protein